MVANDVVLPVDRETAWELLTDEEARQEWLGDEWAEREAVVEAADPGRYLAWWWDDGAHGARVEVVLDPVPAGTRVTVVETPITTPMAVAPMALAAA
jgi:uncharacterized protein YndB with AHSA1/START domain